MPTFAAVDIGSNSCRLKIAEVRQHKLRTLYEDREVTRLGASVFETGVISPESMASTIRALKRFHKATQTHVVDTVRVVATSAMRDARNAPAFIEWVKSETGWNVEVISGLEEGRLIHLGVVTNERGARGRCLMIDLGGGSCEITLSDQGRIREMVSLPLGAVRLQQEFLQTDPPAKGDIARLKKFIRRELMKAERKMGIPRVSLVIATSGTAAALAESSASVTKNTAAAKNKRSKKKVPVQKDFASAELVRAIADRLAKMNNAERAAFPGINERRSEIIIGGAQVYAELLERLALKGFRYSPMGLRDGMLAQMLAQTDQRAVSHKKFEDDRWEAVLEVANRYGVDLRRAGHVCAHAAQIFDALKAVHHLPPEYKFWIESAAMLQDIGKFMNHQGRHRHTQYIIANSEIFGFTPEQRSIVSAIARYLGKSRLSALDRVMRAIPIEEHAHVQSAIVLLRLAMALNQDRASDVLRVRVQIHPKRVTMRVKPGRTGAELEMWALRKEAAYFREVFRRELFAELM
jgi:exopolyphosphatase/guanosine-5'-triphosphate,3'-diphosphate pyrophosphatase